MTGGYNVEQNSEGHVIGAPRAAYWKSGAGGFALIIVPSLDLVIYKMGGNNGQYDLTFTNISQPELRGSREGSEGGEGRNGKSAALTSPPSSASRDILSGDHSRDDWKPVPGAPFQEAIRAGDDGIRRVLEMVSAAVIPK